MMKKSYILLSIILVSFLLTGCGLFNRETEEEINFLEDPTGVYYQIFVRSFADSNGDGVGDFKGITKKLDYLKELGISGIWLMPIHPTDSYHGYDVKDYYAVNPEYGTMEEFEELINEAHKREIKIVIDLVLNHTSSKHPWFIDSMSSPESEYRDYYHWAEEDDYRVTKSTPDGNALWHRVGDNYFASYFPGSYADLNYTNDAVREEAVNIAKYWMEKGVNGFRLDAAMHLFAENKVTLEYGYRDGIFFWARFREQLRAIDPNVYLVGEVYSNYMTYTQYYAGLDSTFNFDLANLIVDVVNRGNGSYTSQLDRIYDRMKDEHGNIYRDAPFLRNHDMNRLANEFNGSGTKLKLAAEMLLTLPGNPYIYYGEEIGMWGAKTEGAHNVYDETRRQSFNWGDESFTTTWLDETCKLDGIACDQWNDPAIEQMEDEESLFNHYKTLIELRKKNPALESRTFIRYEKDGFTSSSLQGYYRYSDDQLLLVLHNFGSMIKPMPEEITGERLIYSSKGAKGSYDDMGMISPGSTLIIQLPYQQLEAIKEA